MLPLSNVRLHLESDALVEAALQREVPLLMVQLAYYPFSLCLDRRPASVAQVSVEILLLVLVKHLLVVDRENLLHDCPALALRASAHLWRKWARVPQIGLWP